MVVVTVICATFGIAALSALVGRQRFSIARHCRSKGALFRKLGERRTRTAQSSLGRIARACAPVSSMCNTQRYPCYPDGTNEARRLFSYEA